MSNIMEQQDLEETRTAFFYGEMVSRPARKDSELTMEQALW